jgi:UDP-N-acetylglucosamine acyltransferase
MTNIHPQAVVSPKAHIGNDVIIHPFALIEDDVVIGDGTIIHPNVVLYNGARIGKECRIFPGAVISAVPQDLKFDNEYSTAEIGDRTTIRECATINRGTSATGKTVIGSDVLFMAYCHAAHDCVVGNHVVISNGSQLGGHVDIGNYVVLGGMSKIHQFCVVGNYAMVGADSMIVKDVAPFTLTDGNPAKLYGINKIGLKRRGFSPETISAIDEFYRILSRSGMNVSDALAHYTQRTTILPEVQLCIDFITHTKRGVYR